jgi:hypothetical protein
MYGMDELKEKLTITESTVSCPVRGCNRQVDRQRQIFRRDESFFCENHQIYISPSTFEYKNEAENILWDFDLLAGHMASKRESRIARDNSEDAVTWNVFHFMERQGILLPYLSSLSEVRLQEAKTIYWSHDLETAKPWNPLWEARKIFEGDPSKGSEPDLIVLSDKILFFIEAKLTASNETQPARLGYSKQYLSGANRWWNHAFISGSDYAQIAEKERKYELMRFWLLGTWMAKQLNRDFVLLNLVRETSEKDIEPRFRKWLPSEKAPNFKRGTWERISQFINSNARSHPAKERIIHYLKTKTIGYRKVGNEWQIQKAFFSECHL